MLIKIFEIIDAGSRERRRKGRTKREEEEVGGIDRPPTDRIDGEDDPSIHPEIPLLHPSVDACRAVSRAFQIRLSRQEKRASPFLSSRCGCESE